MNEKKLMMSSSVSSPDILTYNEKSYNSFTHLVKRKMENYCIDKDSSQTDFERTKKLLYFSKIKIKREERDLINKLSRNKINAKKNLSYYNYSTNNSKINSTDNIFNSSKKSILSVSFPRETFYFSPLHSLGVLKLNSVIHSDVIKSNIERQKLLYNDSIKNSENIRAHILKKMPKIRISRITPKFVNIPIINRVNNTNEKDEEKVEIEKEKEKVKEHITQRINKTSRRNIRFFNPFDDNKLFCYYKYPIINFPESRAQFSLVLTGNLLFLVGGMCCDNSLGELWLCNLINLSWSKIDRPIDIFVKFGHTAVLDKFNSKIFVYGGRGKYDMHITYGKNKYIYCDLDYFDIKLNRWVKPEVLNKNLVPSRRNHIGELIGNQFVIMGGIGEEDNVLNDAYYINLSVVESGKGRWHELSVSPNTPGPYLFGHSSAFVFKNDLLKDNKLSVYQYPEEINEDKFGSHKKRNKIKGIYIFGGKSKYDGIGGLSNDMYVLILGKKPCLWIRLDNVKGVKPKPRYFHSMSYYEPGEFLIIHGGRNDYQNESFALDDTFIFNLSYLQWHQIHLYSTMVGFKVFPRCGHKSIIYSNKLIIFGGMNNLNYLGSSLFVINLSEDYSPEIKTTEEIILENLTRNKSDSSSSPSGKDQNKFIQELKDKINKNPKLGFVHNVNLPWIK